MATKIFNLKTQNQSFLCDHFLICGILSCCFFFEGVNGWHLFITAKWNTNYRYLDLFFQKPVGGWCFSTTFITLVAIALYSFYLHCPARLQYTTHKRNKCYGQVSVKGGGDLRGAFLHHLELVNQKRLEVWREYFQWAQPTEVHRLSNELSSNGQCSLLYSFPFPISPC